MRQRGYWVEMKETLEEMGKTMTAKEIGEAIGKPRADVQQAIQRLGIEAVKEQPKTSRKNKTSLEKCDIAYPDPFSRPYQAAIFYRKNKPEPLSGV